MRVIRVGGVEEPFNLPWILAFEDDAFADLGCEVTFSEFAGGTGALVGALDDGGLDLATVLTEGGVTAIARGSGIRLHSSWTATPLRWGIHVTAGRGVADVADLEGMSFAVSRSGSGSELMAYVLADDRGWALEPDQFVVVGGVDGAVEALPAGRADVFLWERFVTQPLVTAGVFDRVDELPTPWPAFYVAARAELLATDRQLIDRVVEIALAYGNRLVAEPRATGDRNVDPDGMEADDAATWLDGVRWPAEVGVDVEVLATVMVRMAELGRIDGSIPLTELL